MQGFLKVSAFFGGGNRVHLGGSTLLKIIISIESGTLLGAANLSFFFGGGGTPPQNRPPGSPDRPSLNSSKHSSRHSSMHVIWM